MDDKYSKLITLTMSRHKRVAHIEIYLHRHQLLFHYCSASAVVEKPSTSQMGSWRGTKKECHPH
ncbi:hypothetical protein M378DRAFT_729213 [Amanita muscaria Koide BX008]|uniref:Uncharacterized protein n=1 Tax=Amanita muscaria (strain Koide BX008) TaxID=946122 RepID=A0A0C2X1X1_AMAMK|nr:hypothetical protein M378DRAFT_729213 [Amanita muscaria Koide BX008]